MTVLDNQDEAITTVAEIAVTEANECLFKKYLDLEDFVEDSQKIIQDFKCPLCTGVYSEPMVDQCGHVFCKGCIMKYIQNEGKCPINQTKLDGSLISSLSIVREILDKQQVKCKNRDVNCLWTGKLFELEPHLEEKCLRQKVKCTHEECNCFVFREDLESHLIYCEFRIVNCPDCQLEIPYNQIITHQELCPKFKLKCPQECEETVERSEIGWHIRETCLNTVIECPYKEVGCPSKICKKDINDYLKTNFDCHNLMMIQHIKSFTSDVNAKFTHFEKKLRKTEFYEGTIKRLEQSITGENINSISYNEDRHVNRKRQRSNENDFTNEN